MGRRNKTKNEVFENVVIIDVAAEGNAIAKVGEMVVFVPSAVPGDVCDVQILRKRKRYCEGRILNFKKYSPDRISPSCIHFGTCGGCKWQHLPYPKQLYYKQKQVGDQLSRIGRIELPEILSIIGSENEYFYRNKLEFTFSNRRWLSPNEMGQELTAAQKVALGFHVPGLFDKVIDIEKCWLQPEPSNAIRNAIRNFALERELEYFDIRAKQGFLRNITVRTSSTGEVMVIVAFFREEEENRVALLEMLKNQFPSITSLLYVINEKGNDTLTDQEIITYHGNDFIYEEMEGLKFKIGPKSFYQTNSNQACRLYDVVRNLAKLTGNEVVYDLYTGTGTIANFVAKNAKKIVGIEYVPEAIEDARFNSDNNNIGNTLFFAGDMKDILTESFIETHGHPDVIITDPPRAGMHEEVVKTILAAGPDRIVYVSCNPATQARDLGLMKDQYRVSVVQPVDMFPHTHHVENIVLLEKLNQ